MHYISFHPAATAQRTTSNRLHFLQTIIDTLIRRLARTQRSAHSAQHWY